jgi:phenylalanyl-tRNA synthetase beta chain
MCPPVHHDALDIESLKQQTGTHLAARGLREVMTPSLTSAERVRKMDPAAPLVTLRNPLSSELDTLRPTLLPGMLQAISHNLNRQQRDLRFFERGRVYALEGKAKERDVLALAMTGATRESWRIASRRSGLLDVKEEVEALLARMGIAHLAQWRSMEDPWLQQAHEVRLGMDPLGVIGEASDAVLKQHDVQQPVFFAELDEHVLLRHCRSQEIMFQDIPRSPAVRRDLSLLLASDVRFSKLRDVAFQVERKLLRTVDLFDVYEGEKLPKGTKSYALSFILQDPDRTLTDEQVEKAMQRIRQALEKETGATLRS